MSASSATSRSNPARSLHLGAIDLKLTPIARLYGKEPPAWHITDARGVPKDVRPSDFNADFHGPENNQSSDGCRGQW